MAIFARIIATLFLIAYPFGVFFGISHFEPKILSLILIIALLAYLIAPGRAAWQKWQRYFLIGAIISIIILIQLFNDVIFIKLYPVIVGLSFCVAFTYTLFFPPSMIERFARLKHNDLRPEAIKYTRKVTIAWSIFTFLNSMAALYTAFFTSLGTWTLYNGFISYCLMGAMFMGEIIVRRLVIKNNQAKGRREQNVSSSK